MSFIAVCVNCNKRQVYDQPFNDALKLATDGGWLINIQSRFCPDCHKIEQMVDIATKPIDENPECSNCLTYAGDGADNTFRMITNHHPRCQIWQTGNVWQVIRKDDFWSNLERTAKEICRREGWASKAGFDAQMEANIDLGEQNDNLRSIIQQHEAFMLAVAEEFGCLPSFADPDPAKGNKHIIDQIQAFKKQSELNAETRQAFTQKHWQEFEKLKNIVHNQAQHDSADGLQPEVDKKN